MLNCVPDGFKAWEVIMNRVGKVQKVKQTYILEKSNIQIVPLGLDKDYPNCYDFVVIAKDENEAIKIASKKHKEIIDSNAWFEGEESYSKWKSFLTKSI